MGVLSRLLRPEKRDHPANPSPWLLEGIGADTSSGIVVTPENSLTYSAVYAAVRVLAESVSSLPLILYERLQRGKQRASAHPLYSILHDSPNPEMTALEFIETGQAHLALWGNFYAEIEYNMAGQVVGLWPLMPNQMTVDRFGGQLFYNYQLPSGQKVRLQAYQILHVRGLGSNGIVGYSPITLARQSIGLGLAAEKFGSAFFGNGARPGIVLEHPGQISEDAQKRLKDSWEQKHRGLENAHRVAILEEGMKIEEIGIPPEDAQFLQTRQFQVTEIARIYRIPPHMLADLTRATFSNIEQQSIEFVVHTLRPWLVRWERRINLSLLSQVDRQRLFSEFLVDGMLRGDTPSRYQAYSIARQWGWLSANDVREIENMNPVDGGDAYLVPLNMVEAGSIGALDAQSEQPLTPQTRAAPSAQVAPQYERRSATIRHRLALTYRRTLQDVAQRIVNREVNDIGNAARRLLNQRGRPEFEEWLRTFFEDHAAVVQRYLWPVVLTYAELVAQEIENETGRQASEADLQAFVEDYLQSRTNVWLARAQSRLLNSLDGIPDGITPLDAIEQELADRKEKQAGVFSMDEAIRINNAVAHKSYTLVGVRRLRWAAFNENCPYCGHLDGATVEITKWFLPQGESMQPEGATAFTSESNIGHPPLHSGCDCMVVAG